MEKRVKMFGSVVAFRFNTDGEDPGLTAHHAPLSDGWDVDAEVHEEPLPLFEESFKDGFREIALRCLPLQKEMCVLDVWVLTDTRYYSKAFDGDCNHNRIVMPVAIAGEHEVWFTDFVDLPF